MKNIMIIALLFISYACAGNAQGTKRNHKKEKENQTMKKRKTASGLMLTGSFRQSGVTIYQRNGKLVTRTATWRS